MRGADDDDGADFVPQAENIDENDLHADAKDDEEADADGDEDLPDDDEGADDADEDDDKVEDVDEEGDGAEEKDDDDDEEDDDAQNGADEDVEKPVEKIPSSKPSPAKPSAVTMNGDASPPKVENGVAQNVEQEAVDPEKSGTEGTE